MKIVYASTLAVILISLAPPSPGATPPEELKVDGVLGPPARLSDGSLIAFAVSGDAMLYRRQSTDGGRTWSEPHYAITYPLGEEPIENAAYTLVDRANCIHVFRIKYHKLATPREPMAGRSEVLHAMSADSGATWSKPKAINFGHSYTGALNSCIQLGNGRLLLALSYATQNIIQRAHQVEFRVATAYSDSGGGDWHPGADDLSVPLGPLEGHPGAIEPILMELKDGRVWMLIRTQTTRFYEAFSTDGGRTWTKPRASPFLAPNSPGGFLRLSDGRIALCWNAFAHYPDGVSGDKLGFRKYLYVALSSDDGKTWTPPRCVAPVRDRDADRSRAQYPFLCENKDGDILVYYTRFRSKSDTEPDDTATREFVRVKPAWITSAERP
jgi:hypothetical protein